MGLGEPVAPSPKIANLVNKWIKEGWQVGKLTNVNVERFYELLEILKYDFEHFKKQVDRLDPKDRMEILRLFENMVNYLDMNTKPHFEQK